MQGCVVRFVYERGMLFREVQSAARYGEEADPSKAGIGGYRFKIPEKFRFRAIFRDFWSRGRRNHFFRYRSFPDFLIKETEM
jgi:hypothetical protein